jgi:hypothetical protein
MGLTPRQTDWRETASRKVTFTLSSGFHFNWPQWDEEVPGESFRLRLQLVVVDSRGGCFIANNVPVVCGVGAVTCSRDARKRAIQCRYRHAATSSLQLLRLQARQGRDANEKVAESAQDYNGNGVLFQPPHPRTTLSFTGQCLPLPRGTTNKY